MKYNAEVIDLKSGFFGREGKIAEAIQPVLDRYTADGWELHTCSISGSDRGSAVLLIFKKSS